MEKINVGVIGLGTIATNTHIPILYEYERAKIVAVAEVNLRRGKNIAKRWNIPEVYQDHNVMFDNSNLKAVFVCVPNFLHSQIVSDALKHDIHVFCEKPFGLSSNDAFQLVNEANSRNLVLTVGYNRRLEKSFKEAVNIVESLRLGKVTQINGVFVCGGPYQGYVPSSNWFFQDKSGGALYDIGSHLFDLLTYILSDNIIEIFSQSKNVLCTNTIDNICGTFETEKGSIGTFNLGWQTSIDRLSISLYGTGGSLFIDPVELKEIHREDGSLEKMFRHLESAKKIVGKTLRTTENSINQTYVDFDRAFIDSIIDNKLPIVLGKEAVHVLEVLEAINESLNKRKPIKVYRHF